MVAGHQRLLLTALVCGLLVSFKALHSQPVHPELWLAPLPPIQRPDGARAGAKDYEMLFLPGAPWVVVAKHLSVFKIYPELLRDASDVDLRHLID